VDWKLHAEVLHEWVPEAIRELLSEAGVRNPLIRHPRDDIQAPEYVAEGVAELSGREARVTPPTSMSLLTTKRAKPRCSTRASRWGSRPPASYLTTTPCRAC